MDWLNDLPFPLIMFGIIIPVEFGIIAIVAFTLKKFGVNIRDVWLQGTKNAFFTSLIIGAIVGAIAIIPIFGFGESIHNGFAVSIGILWCVMFLWFYFNLFSLKQKAGRELLDIAPIPNGWLSLVMGIILIVSGFSGGIADFLWKDMKYSWLISMVMGLSGGVFFIIMCFSRIRIHENGILAYVDLIKWSKIESFEWINDNEKAYTLKLRYKGKTPEFLRTGAIPVPTEKKAHFESLLKQFCQK